MTSLAEAAIYREALDTLRTDVLEQELERRRAWVAKGMCPYCQKPLGSQPACRATSQHAKP